MNWFRELIFSLSNLKGFEGWVIAKVKVDLDNFWGEDISPNVIKANRKYAVINVSRQCFLSSHKFMCHMTVYLIKPYEIKRNKSGDINKKGEIENEFSGQNLFFKSVYKKDVIEKFVEDVGDKNYIHRTDMPIVPGFLIIEELIFNIIEEVKESENLLYNKLHLEIVFYNPLYSGEIMEVYKSFIDSCTCFFEKHLKFSGKYIFE